MGSSAGAGAGASGCAGVDVTVSTPTTGLSSLWRGVVSRGDVVAVPAGSAVDSEVAFAGDDFAEAGFEEAGSEAAGFEVVRFAVVEEEAEGFLVSAVGEAAAPAFLAAATAGSASVAFVGAEFFAAVLFAAARFGAGALAAVLLGAAFFAVPLEEEVLREDRVEVEVFEDSFCGSSSAPLDFVDAAPERAAPEPLVRPRRSAAARAIPVARS